MGKLEGGKYFIKNESSTDAAKLPSNESGKPVTVGQMTTNKVEKWWVEELDNGKYTISNAGYSSKTYVTGKTAKSEKITASTETITQWKIVEAGTNTNKYRIALGNYVWTAEPGSKDVTLTQTDLDEDTQLWVFDKTN